MSALPELDELDPDRVTAGDTPRFTAERSGLYGPDGDFLTGHVTDDTADEYVAAWRQISAAKPDPGNWRRSTTYTRAGEYFIVFTEYLGLDMDLDLSALLGRPHLPLTWETKVFGTGGDLLIWRYHTRAAAFAGHEQVVSALSNGAGVEEAPEAELTLKAVTLSTDQDQLAP